MIQKVNENVMATTLRVTGLAAFILGLAIASPIRAWAAGINDVSNNIQAESISGCAISIDCISLYSGSDFNGAPPKKPAPKPGTTQSSGSR